jgi:hypothetical protein
MAGARQMLGGPAVRRRPRWGLALVALVAVVALAGCSSSKKSPKSVPESGALKAKLLALSDLPEGWKLDSSKSTDSTDTSSSQEPACIRNLKEDFNGQTGKASASFTAADDIPAVEEDLGSFESGAATDAIATVKKVLDGCKDFSFEDSGTKFKATLKRGTLASFGDESVAYVGSFSAQGVDGELWFVFVRKGDTAGIFSYVGIGSVDTDQLKQIVDTGVAKL